jgi:hypothetical protein
MRCHEARRLLGPFLDSELDAKSNCEIEDHLAACPPCADYFKAEERMESRIKDCVCSGEKSDDLWDDVEETATHTGLVFLPQKKPRVLWYSAAAVAAATVIGLGIVWSAHASPPELAPELARRHQAYLDGIVEPAFMCPKGQDIAGKCDGRLDEAAFSALPCVESFHAVGARVCRIDSTPVAWTMASSAGVPVSIISFRRSELAKFPETARMLAGATQVSCRSGRFIISIRAVGDYVTCAVAAASEPFVADLVSKVAEPGMQVAGS